MKTPICSIRHSDYRQAIELALLLLKAGLDQLHASVQPQGRAPPLVASLGASAVLPPYIQPNSLVGVATRGDATAAFGPIAAALLGANTCKSRRRHGATTAQVYVALPVRALISADVCQVCSWQQSTTGVKNRNWQACRRRQVLQCSLLAAMDTIMLVSLCDSSRMQHRIDADSKTLLQTAACPEELQRPAGKPW